jgi:hypothetical protein
MSDSDNRPETAPLRMKIRPAAPADEDYDPAEPSRYSSRPALPVAEEPVAPAAVESDAATAEAPSAPETASLAIWVPASVTAPMSRAYVPPASVSFTNRLSISHRALLKQLTDAEGSTIRSILEKSLDLYAEQKHPELEK